VNPKILIRGDRFKPGQPVPRRIPQILAGVDDHAFTDDGRLELAEALASPKNPLTARVIVNRVWQQHFGRGLVSTADNFGAMGERPSHPELLDHLASWFIAHGWFSKALHRYILASATWQQSSAVQTAALEQDAGNSLLWRMNPAPLSSSKPSATVCSASPVGSTRASAAAAPCSTTTTSVAPSMATPIVSAFPPRCAIFDGANPDQSIARRSETIHPLQALYFLNSPFLRAQAENVNRQPEIAELLDVRERVAALYKRILIRRPQPEELDLARAYLGSAPTDAQWIQFAQVLLLSNEFFFCD